MCDEVASGELFLLRNIQEDPAAPWGHFSIIEQCSLISLGSPLPWWTYPPAGREQFGKAKSLGMAELPLLTRPLEHLQWFCCYSCTQETRGEGKFISI